jgi:CDP-diacylglycerol--glycerol-3-phosphate 3-phosphatidyltransferase
MYWDSIWISVVPLALVNIFFVVTLLIFRPIYHKQERRQDVENRHASRFLNRWMREYWHWLTDPVVNAFVKMRISPNTLTVIGVLLSIVAGFLFWMGLFGMGGWTMIFAATFDMFDGNVARKTNQVSQSGAYFDSVMDRVSEGAVFVGLAFLYRNHWGLFFVLLALIGSVMVSYSKARGDASGAVYSGGSMQRPERIVYLGVGAIFTPLVAFLIRPFCDWISPFHVYLIPLCFVALATSVTSYHRISHVMGMLDAKDVKNVPLKGPGEYAEKN